MKRFFTVFLFLLVGCDGSAEILARDATLDVGVSDGVSSSEDSTSIRDVSDAGMDSGMDARSDH